MILGLPETAGSRRGVIDPRCGLNNTKVNNNIDNNTKANNNIYNNTKANNDTKVSINSYYNTSESHPTNNDIDYTNYKTNNNNIISNNRQQQHTTDNRQQQQTTTDNKLDVQLSVVRSGWRWCG